MRLADIPRFDALPDAKVGHGQIAAAPPFGPTVYLIVRVAGKMLDVQPTRHDAVGRIAEFHGPRDWYEVVPVPVGAIPIGDLSNPGAQP